jgi:hypothetical protein
MLSLSISQFAHSGPRKSLLDMCVAEPARTLHRKPPGKAVRRVFSRSAISAPETSSVSFLARPIREIAVFGRIDAAAHLL